MKINKDSEIFLGHFPDKPVLAGACMLQMVKEVLENALNTSLRLKKADQIKFLRIVDPSVVDMIDLKITWTALDVNLDINATLFSASLACFKLKGTFVNQ